MYNHRNQYRCHIIRAKSIGEMDDILPTYARIINDICPCSEDEFNIKFDNEIIKILSKPTQKKPDKKTLDNHRTEIAGSLFGMYNEEDDGNIYASERTMKYLDDNDQPAFFKDICFKFQFPSGMQSIQTIRDRIENNLNIRPVPFVIKVLLEVKKLDIVLNNKQIGYYILNSLDVLQGLARPDEVVAQIQDDFSNNIEREIFIPNKASSYTMQHIRELIKYMEFANLIIQCKKGKKREVHLNTNDLNSLEYFASFYDKKPAFDMYRIAFNTVENRKQLKYEWKKYFGKLSEDVELFTTTVESLGITEEFKSQQTKKDTVAIGDEGELIVYEYEKRRVAAFNKWLANKVLHLGKTRGLGYDIQSVIAEPGDKAEFVKYIEVKSTKRVTEPNFHDSKWGDNINITRNEWVAAQQHSNFYSIYRVYLIRGKVIMYVIENIPDKVNEGRIKIVPLTYRVDFYGDAIDKVIDDKEVLNV